MMPQHAPFGAVTFSIPQLLTLFVIGVLIYGFSQLRPKR